MVDKYYVGYVSLMGGLVTFNAGNIEEEGLNLWDYRVEPYFKSREFVLYSREAERYFKETCQSEYPTCLQREQYCPDQVETPRYWSPYIFPGDCANPF